ncbi:MAG TPA: amidohydrolase, partial [Bifidobacterium sp.]|nr:amidohydrolase [Bifidobacterium sp.]
MVESCVIGSVRFIGSSQPVDIAVAQGRIAAVLPARNTHDDASATWVIPGLWDYHTHFTQWAYTLGRLDLIDARSADEALDMLRAHLAER